MANKHTSLDEISELADDSQREAVCENEPIRTLTLASGDRLHITWGAIVSQRAGDQLHQFTAVEDSHMFLYVNRGTLRARIGQETRTVSPGQALLVWPGETCVGVEPHRAEFLCQWLSFAVKQSHRRNRQADVHLSRVANASDPGLVSELLRLLIEEYHKHQSKGQTGTPLCSQAPHHLLMSLLSSFGPDQPEDVRPSSAPAVLAERARNHMRANPGAVSSIGQLASMLNCSVGYLRTAFRATYGLSPLAYLRRFRMLEARRYLVYTDLPISQIALRCGYADPGHFARVFAREHGIAPTSYRIAHSNQYTTPGI